MGCSGACVLTESWRPSPVSQDHVAFAGAAAESANPGELPFQGRDKAFSLRWEGRRRKHCECIAFGPCDPGRMDFARSKLSEVGVPRRIKPCQDPVGGAWIHRAYAATGDIRRAWDRLHDKDRNLPNMPTACWQGGRNRVEHMFCDGLLRKQSNSRSSRRIAGLPRDRKRCALDDAS